MTTRRSFLRLMGGGAVLAAGSGAAWLATRTPAAALAPWQAATGYAEPRRAALAHALLAPNPHNRQPWLVELQGTDGVILHRDPDRDLPVTDPFDRQIFIGLGCFLEQMVIAATQSGHAVDLEILPEGDAGPIAMATFRAGGAAPDPLAAHILARRSNKMPYAATPLTQAENAELSRYATLHTDAAQVAALRKLIFDALMVEMLTEPALRESIDLMRVGKAEINANPDGIEMRSPLLEAARVVGFLTEDVLMDTESGAFQGVIAEYRETFEATPAFAALVTDGNTRADQIGAGRDWLRLNLAATALGLGLHPVSQALQEYPEMAAHYAQAHAMLAAPGQTVQMLGRLGRPTMVSDPTPRWALETRLLDG